jgi:hypothetical protein
MVGVAEPVKFTHALAIPVIPFCVARTPLGAFKVVTVAVGMVAVPVNVGLAVKATVPLVAGKSNTVVPATAGSCNVTLPEVLP